MEENNIKQLAKKNYLLLLFEIFASMMIVFFFFFFPGLFGELFAYFARFGVPFFFMVSGFFLFRENEFEVQTNTKDIRGKIKKRIVRLLILLFISFVTYLCLNLWFERDNIPLFFSSVFSFKKIIFFILFNVPFFAGHNWFLLSLIYVYLIILCFPLLFKNKPFLYICSFLSVICIITHLMTFQINTSIFDINIYDLMFYRNWLFNGLPFVAIGILLRQSISKTIKLNSLLSIFALVLTSFLMVVELYIYANFLNAVIEFGFFTIIFCLLVFIVSFKHPLRSLGKSRLLNTRINCSTFIYIFHPGMSSIVSVFALRTGFYSNSIYHYIKPAIVLFISFFVAILICFCFDLLCEHFLFNKSHQEKL